MITRITEIKSQPKMIVRTSHYARLDQETMQRLHHDVNAQLIGEDNPLAVILPNCLEFAGWEYGRIETITEYDTGEIIHVTADEGGEDDAEAEDAAGPADDL